MLHPKAQSILAGMAAGALGGLALLVFSGLAGLVQQETWWRYANLLGTIFYGASALRAGPGVVSLAGAAFQIVICGFAGGLFALAFARVDRSSRLVLLGISAGLCVGYAAGLVFQSIAPLVNLYSDRVPTVLGYAVYGVFLGLACSFLPRNPEADRVQTSKSEAAAEMLHSANARTELHAETAPSSATPSISGEEPVSNTVCDRPEQ